MDWRAARDELRKWREENSRCSKDIVQLWEDVLESHAAKLGSEQWLALEQVFIAALDCGRLELADRCLKTLKDRFPASLRIKRLTGMKLEAIGRFDQAKDLYDSIIKSEETHAQARKRKVAILKAQRRISEAIHELSEYLKLFMGDQEAWLELCDLYVNEGEYVKAAFCLEEVILLNPHCHYYHQKYAEIRYTMGGYDNVELARAYFCQAVKLKEDNARALYGILLTCGHLASSPKSNAAKKKELLRLVHWASERLKEVYIGEEAVAGSPSVESLPPIASAANGSGGKKKKGSPGVSTASVPSTALVKSAIGDLDRKELSADVDSVEALISALALLPNSAP